MLKNFPHENPLPNKHWAYSLEMISVSFIFLTMQFFVLSSALIDVFHSTCSRNDDCRVGTYCSRSSKPHLHHTGKCKFLTFS